MFLCFSSGGDVELGVSYGGKTKDLFLPKIFGVGAGGVCFGGPSVRRRLLPGSGELLRPESREKM